MAILQPNAIHQPQFCRISVMTQSIDITSLQQGSLMDNPRCHNVAGIWEAIENCQAQLLHLPPYSPDLGPIEQAVAKLKVFPRKAGERTRDGLRYAISHSLELYSPAECQNLFRHLGCPT